MPICTRSTNPDIDPISDNDPQGEASGQTHEDNFNYPDNDTAPNLAEAITLMTKELKRHEPAAPSSSVANAKKPDTFDGFDPKKLSNFILLCNLFFRSNSTYSEDEAKVTFALSYLRGLTLDYFKPVFSNSNVTPDWLEDWSAFI
jgi:hypothetical protein